MFDQEPSSLSSSSPFSLGGNLQKSKQQHHPHPNRLLTLLKHARLKDALATSLSVHIRTKMRSLAVSYEERAVHMDKYDYSLDEYGDFDDVSGAGVEASVHSQVEHVRLLHERQAPSNCTISAS